MCNGFGHCMSPLPLQRFTPSSLRSRLRAFQPQRRRALGCLRHWPASAYFLASQVPLLQRQQRRPHPVRRLWRPQAPSLKAVAVGAAGAPTPALALALEAVAVGLQAARGGARVGLAAAGLQAAVVLLVGGGAQAADYLLGLQGSAQPCGPTMATTISCA